ncbi:LORF1 protein, partial [Crocuta crocuta]
NAINEIHNKMEASNEQTEKAERRISDLEDTIIEKEETEKKRDKLIQEHERRVRELSDTIKWNNIRIIGIPEEEDIKKGAEGVLEQIIAENFPNLGREIDVEIQEAQITPLRRNLNRSSA